MISGKGRAFNKFLYFVNKCKQKYTVGGNVQAGLRCLGFINALGEEGDWAGKRPLFFQEIPGILVSIFPLIGVLKPVQGCRNYLLNPSVNSIKK